MIIVEGPDLAGKTTLANAIVKTGRRPFVYQHMTALPMCFTWKDYFPLITKNVVMDRFHMSEPVYSYARNELACRICENRYKLVDAACAAEGSVTVVLIPSERLIRSEWGRDEMYDLDTVLRSRHAYEMFIKGEQVVGACQSMTPDFVYINFDQRPDVNKLANAVVDLYDVRRHLCEQI